MTQKFVPLHNHCDTSFLDGYQTAEELCDRCEELGVTACALTDHGTCAGHEMFDWQIVSRKLNFKPIFGIEAYLCEDVDNHTSDRVAKDKKGNVKYDPKTGEPVMEKQKPRDFNHACLWAQDDEGLENLWTLSTLAYTDGFYYKPRIDLAMLRKHHKGLFVSDGCMLSQVSRAIVSGNIAKAYEWEQKLIDIFGKDNVLVEIHTCQFVEPHTDEQRKLNEDMCKTNLHKIQIARKLGLRMIAVNDSHYAKREDYKWHELEWATTTGKGDAYNDDKTGGGRGETAAWVMSDDEVRYWLGRHSIPKDIIEECIDNTQWVAEHCNAKLKRGMVPPRYKETKEEDEKHFDKVLMDGIRELVPRDKVEQYLDELNKEVELIKKSDLTGYFNTVADYSNFVRDEDVDGEKYGVPGKKASLLGAGRGCFLPGNLVSTFRRGVPHRDLYPETGYEFDEPLKRIESISIGQKVLTHDGTFQKVLDKYEYDVVDEDCVEIVLSNGHTIRCTADHCIYRAGDGFVRADELNDGDVLEGAYRPKELIEFDVECNDCHKTYKMDFSSYKHLVSTGSPIKADGAQLRKRGEIVCAHCLDSRKWHYMSRLGSDANRCEKSKQKNREAQLKRYADKPELRQHLSDKAAAWYTNPDNRAYHAERTSIGISSIPHDKYVRMSTAAKNYKSGKFYSQKNNKHIWFASSLELKAIHVLETDSNVLWYDRAKDRNGNELFIKYADGHRYNPDFIVKYADGAEKIIEVKAGFAVHSDVVQAKADAARKYCNDNGMQYEIWTEVELQQMNDAMHKSIVVESVKHFKYTGKVYDLHVDNVHNYTVGRVTVHNSAGGSLVCYLMHITNVDPIKFGLFFERFLTAGRVMETVTCEYEDGTSKTFTDVHEEVKLADGTTKEAWQQIDESWDTEYGKLKHTSFVFKDCPDIDLDFEASVIPYLNKYLKLKYGEYGFCQIGTQLLLKMSMAIKDVGKVHGMTPAALNDVVKRMAATGWRMEDWVSEHTYEEMVEWFCKTHRDEVVADLFENSDFMWQAYNWGGRFRGEGVHASGYVISKKPMLGKLPLRIKDGVLVTQFEHNGIARLGFIKYDILKLSSLGVIRECYELTHNGKLDVKDVYREMRDERTSENADMWKQTWSGDTIGIFQMDTPLGTKTAMNARMKSLRDAAMLSAVDRPGMVISGRINDFYKVRLGKEPIMQYHPFVDDILAETSGFIVYQEQIMSIFGRLCHYNPAQRDYIRKIIGKKLRFEMPKQKAVLDKCCLEDEAFVKAVPSKYKDAQECVDDLWNGITGAGSYAFNKSHCLHGSTKVKLANGEVTSLANLYNMYKAGEELSIMSMMPDGSIAPAKVAEVIDSGIKALLTITLADGKTINCTPEHRLLTPNGYKATKELNVGDSVVVDNGADYSIIATSNVFAYTQVSEAIKYAHDYNVDATDGQTINSILQYLSCRGVQYKTDCYMQIGDKKVHADLEIAGVPFNVYDSDFVEHSNECMPLYADTWKYTIDAVLMGQHIAGVEIVSIEQYAGIHARTYDVVMDDHYPSNFIANGIVSHNSVAYGMITYEQQRYKYKHPEVFMVASMNNNMGDPEYVTYAKVHGMQIAPPNVNKSSWRYELSDGAIYMPLSIIKGVGGAAVDEILRGQPFSSFDDYLARTSGRGGRKRNIVKALISVGAFDGVDERDRFQLMVDYKTSIKEEPPKRNTWKNPRVRGKIEQELIGISLSYDPVLDNRQWLESQGPQTYADMLQHEVGDGICVAGKVESIRRHIQKNGGEMAWIAVQLVSHEVVTVTMFATNWSKCKDLVAPNDIVAFNCKRTNDYNGKMSIVGFSCKNHSIELSQEEA